MCIIQICKIRNALQNKQTQYADRILSYHYTHILLVSTCQFDTYRSKQTTAIVLNGTASFFAGNEHFRVFFSFLLVYFNNEFTITPSLVPNLQAPWGDTQSATPHSPFKKEVPTAVNLSAKSYPSAQVNIV